METPPAKTFYEQVVSICSCLPKKPKSANVSRDFWMPDHSCSVCYECDSQFTIFNRRHHCRVCGRIFCGNCSANSIPAPLDEPKTELEEEREERIRVCYYCFKQWEQETAANDNNRIQLSSPILSTSSSAISSHMIKSIAEGHINSDECDMTTLYDLEGKDIGPVDLEINGLLWLPPEPEDEEDEREDVLFDDNDGFLADEGASLPELPLKSPIIVALPDKPSSIDGSISTIPGFSVPATGEALRSQSSTGEGTSDLATLQQDGYNYHEELGSSKEDFPQGTPDHQSILVFLSSRCIWKGTVCERAHLFRIKYYGSSDKPLGRFLRDHLFDQSFRCRSCEMPSEAHVHSYTHRQGTLTISVKKLPELLLPGEREGKIWMWHRCLRCPRIDGFPPATRRVVMSDAAWGLSFGKFLELSFSNHAAASMVASCGHSLHRDCLRFYGFGRMVACFHYASIDVHSIYLPPSKLDFKYNNQEWIEKEVNKVNETCVRVYDGEVTSVIAFALISADYYVQLSDDRETPKDCAESSVSLPIYDAVDLDTNHLFDKTPFKVPSESVRALLYSKSLHANVSFTDVGPLGKVNYTVTCYFAKRFDALRRICCPSELDFTRSLARCKKWESQGGKRNVFFAKTLDDRFIIKQVTKAELEFFMQFAPEYFKYVSESIVEETPSCLAKILGIYQVTSKLHKGGMESRMDVLVMENLLFGRNVTRLYDLKGSSQSRYNPDASGSNKVLLDQNLIEAMATSPIFVGNKAKRLLERAIWNDTSFLESIDVMDYSLFVGVDEEKHELVVGTIDFLKQYTWDKHLETWVKSLGILGGSKNSSPTVISPKQYKKRFRKAMSEYFLMVPDQ